MASSAGSAASVRMSALYTPKCSNRLCPFEFASSRPIDVDQSVMSDASKERMVVTPPPRVLEHLEPGARGQVVPPLLRHVGPLQHPFKTFQHFIVLRQTFEDDNRRGRRERDHSVKRITCFHAHAKVDGITVLPPCSTAHSCVLQNATSFIQDFKRPHARGRINIRIFTNQ